MARTGASVTLDGAPRASRRGLRNVAAAALVCALSLGAAELILRARERAQSRPVHPTLGVRGYRGAPFERERPARGVRVIAVGDDSTWGSGLPAEHAWPELLEGLFARDGRASRVEVLNAAEPGADAARVRELVNSHVLALQPTWLVIALGASDTRRALEASAARPWWWGSALARALASPPQPTEWSHESALELVRRARFTFGVELAQLVESAWNKRCYVAIVQTPWPPAPGDAPPAASAQLDSRELARRVHAALCEEAAHVARVHDVALIDARGALEFESFDERGQLELRGAQALAQAVYADLRARIP